jgi:hypothetical protein
MADPAAAADVQPTPRGQLPPPPSEGCRLLRAATAGRSLAQVCAAIGSKNKTQVNDILRGLRVPSPAMRGSIHAVYSIEPDAWSRAANGGSSALANATPPADLGPPPPTLQHCLEVLQSIRVARSEGNLVASERVKLADTETKILGLRARLEMQQELSEHRIVRAHPEWHRIKRLIARALKPYPQATRAVVEALQEDLDNAATTNQPR